jgi:hypothetical protein
VRPAGSRRGSWRTPRSIGMAGTTGGVTPGYFCGMAPAMIIERN